MDDDDAARGGMIITSAFLASRLGWPTDRATRWLIKTGAGIRRGGSTSNGRRYYTTPSKLRIHWEEAYEAIQEDWLAHLTEIGRRIQAAGRAKRKAARLPAHRFATPDK